MKKDIQVNTNQKKADTDTMTLKAENITKDRNKHYIMINESIIKIPRLYVRTVYDCFKIYKTKHKRAYTI